MEPLSELLDMVLQSSRKMILFSKRRARCPPIQATVQTAEKLVSSAASEPFHLNHKKEIKHVNR